MNNSSNSDFRTVRGYQLANQHEGQLTPAMEDYLEMTYRLCIESGYTRVGKLSELLHVKPPSASKMISKLTILGYLKYDRYEIIKLTDEGHKIGAYLLKRHETIEKFLTLIGSCNSLEETELIEHYVSTSTISNLDNLIEFLKSEEVERRYKEFKKNTDLML